MYYSPIRASLVAQQLRICLYAGHMGLIPGSGRSLGEGNGNPLQYSCLGNPMHRGAWWATVHEVTKELDTTKQQSIVLLCHRSEFSLQFFGLFTCFYFNAIVIKKLSSYIFCRTSPFYLVFSFNNDLYINRDSFPYTCCCSVAKLCLTLRDPMGCSMPGSPVPHHLLEFAQVHVHWIGDAIQHLILCLLILLPSMFPSIRVFSSDSAVCIRWPKYWNFSISPSKEYSGLISFKIDWFDLLDFQGTLKCLLQHHSSKASILHCTVKDFSVVNETEVDAFLAFPCFLYDPVNFGSYLWFLCSF